MIEGLHFDVKSEAMSEHLHERAAYHNQRAAFYREKMASLRVVEKDSPATTYSGQQDPLQAMQKRLDEHEKKADLFQFMLEHLVEDEVYRLSEHDLQRIEFVSDARGWQ